MPHDVAYAVRSLLRARSFTAIAILTIALGIAINTGVFTILNALALRPMPVRDPSAVVRMLPVDTRGQRHNLFSYPDYLDYRASMPVFTGVAAYVPVELSARTSGGESREALGYVAGPEYFTTLGIHLSRGRIFEDHDGPFAAVIGHTFWQRQFHADPSAIGAQVILNGRPFTVVGVGPAEFQGTEPLVPDVWVPLSAQSVVLPGKDALTDRDHTWLLVVGRLSPGKNREAAERHASLVASRLAAAYPGPERPVVIQVVQGTFFPLDPALAPLIGVVMIITGLVLTIACANVGSLVLTRITNRGHELAVRRALGASRVQLIRLLLVESLVLGAAGGATGLLLSVWTLRFLYPLALTLLPYSWTTILDLSPDWRVCLYTSGAALAASAAFGVAPALIGTRLAPSAVLQSHSASGAIRGPRARLRAVLVVTQVAVCLTLLVAGALLARGLQHARALDLGFSVRGVVHMQLDLRRDGYTEAQAAHFVDGLLQRLEGNPSVATVALASHVPLTGGVQRTEIFLESSRDAATRHWATRAFVSPEYFGVLDLPIVRGRNFTSARSADDATAVVISEGLAARFWPGQDAIGRRVRAPGWTAPRTVVGIVRDTSTATIWREKEMAVYLPLGPDLDPRSLRVLVRAAGSTTGAGDALRSAARAGDPVVTTRVAPLETLLAQWILPSRIGAIAAGVLASLALGLAAIGLYGVIGAAVAQRTREIGIRAALGANRRDVIALVVRDGARLIGLGLCAGLLGSFAAGRLLGGLIFGVSTVDPIAFAASVGLLTVTGLAACYLPARRAARIEPIDALRS